MAAIWSEIKNALSGAEDHDFTTGSLNRSIFLLAIPMVLEMFMESMFAIVDIYFVAHLGAYAAAAVQLTEAILVFVYALGIGLAMGTTAVVARRIGEKDPEGAARAAFQAVVIAAGVGITLVCVGVPLAPQLLAAMGADPVTLERGSMFSRFALGSSGAIMLLFLMNAIFRGAGDAALALRVLILANGINIILVPCLVNGWGPFPQLGLTGSGVATLIGRSTGVVLQLWLLFRPGHRIHVRRDQWKVDWPSLKKIIELSGMAIVQFLLSTGSWTFMSRLVAKFGVEASAGYGIAIRIFIFTLLPSWGLGGAAATLVGQSLGAKNPDRAEAAVWRAAQFNAVFLGLVSIVFMTIPDKLMRIFIQDPAVVAIGADCLRIFSYDYVVFAFGMVIVQAFNGAGDTRTPMLINLGVYWGFQLAFASYLTSTSLGARGVFWSVMVSELILTVVSVIVFRQGRWKKIAV